MAGIAAAANEGARTPLTAMPGINLDRRIFLIINGLLCGHGPTTFTHAPRREPTDQETYWHTNRRSSTPASTPQAWSSRYVYHLPESSVKRSTQLGRFQSQVSLMGRLSTRRKMLSNVRSVSWPLA